MATYRSKCVLAIVCLSLVLIPCSSLSSQTNAVTATAGGDTTPPVIYIVSPTDGSTVTGTKVRVNFYAFDAGGFDRYELYVDGVLKQTILPTAKNPYFTWNAGKSGGGDYTLVVRGYDLAGNVGTSPQITVYR